MYKAGKTIYLVAALLYMPFLIDFTYSQPPIPPIPADAPGFYREITGTDLGTEPIQTGVHYASLDPAIIWAYNPAGISSLKKGIYANIGNRSVFRNSSHQFTFPDQTKEIKHSQSSTDFLLPEFYLAYKAEKFAIYGGYYISGFGNINYKTGSVNTDLVGRKFPDEHYQSDGCTLKGSSYYKTPVLGISYIINSAFSVTAAVKYILADNQKKIEFAIIDLNNPLAPAKTLTMESADKASGTGFKFGINYHPNDQLNLSLQYESKIKLEFITDSVKDNTYTIKDGAKTRRDMPATLAFGANYNFNDKLSAMFDFDWFFQKKADWGTDTSSDKDWSAMAGDAARFGLGVNYDFNPNFKASCFGGYSLCFYKDKSLFFTRFGSFENLRDNHWTIGLNGQYSINKMIKIDLSILRAFWKKNDVITETLKTKSYDISNNNQLTSIRLGVDFNILPRYCPAKF